MIVSTREAAIKMVGHQQLSEVYPLWELCQLHIVLYPALTQQTSSFLFGAVMGDQWFYSVSPGEKEARKEEVIFCFNKSK